MGKQHELISQKIRRRTWRRTRRRWRTTQIHRLRRTRRQYQHTHHHPHRHCRQKHQRQNRRLLRSSHRRRWNRHGSRRLSIRKSWDLVHQRRGGKRNVWSLTSIKWLKKRNHWHLRGKRLQYRWIKQNSRPYCHQQASLCEHHDALGVRPCRYRWSYGFEMRYCHSHLLHDSGSPPSHSLLYCLGNCKKSCSPDYSSDHNRSALTVQFRSSKGFDDWFESLEIRHLNNDYRYCDHSYRLRSRINL